MANLYSISNRANVNAYSYQDKYIFVYDDHRTLLNVLFEAKKLNSFPQTPNLIYFDRHDDACETKPLSGLLDLMGAGDLSTLTSKQFWSFVEFDLSPLDDDWLLTGMELDLIKDAIVIGQVDNSNIDKLGNKYTSEDEVEHELYCIPHLEHSLGGRGCLGDSIIKEPYYENVRNIMQYNQGYFFHEEIRPFVLDFDLDCFTTVTREKTHAWPEVVFKNEYVDNRTVRYFMQKLLKRSSFITVCREPGSCGGIGEANKILHYLDKYFFDGNLNTIPVF